MDVRPAVRHARALGVRAPAPRQRIAVNGAEQRVRFHAGSAVVPLPPEPQLTEARVRSRNETAAAGLERSEGQRRLCGNLRGWSSDRPRAVLA